MPYATCFMKIGIDIRLIGKKRTGDEIVFLNLVKNLAKIDAENKYFLFADSRQVEIISDIADMLGISGKSNFQIIALETGNKFKWNFHTLPKYLKHNPVVIYLTQYITPFFVSKDIKIITIVHDISFNFFGQFIKFKDLFFLKTLIPVSLKRADKVIGVSEFTKDEIIKYYKIDSTKVDFMYNSIGDEFWSNTYSQKEIDEVRNRYKLPEKFILYMGTLQPRKNIPQLIEAFARITDRLDGVKIVLGGNRNGHNFDEKIDKSIAKYELGDRVVFTGFVDEKDKAIVFALAQSFVFPSIYEGFGIPVLEAMSQKVPVLASSIPSLKEIAGESALYFDLEDIDDFSKKLYDISMNNELRNKLIQSGLERISFFSWEKTANKMLAIFKKLKND